MTDHQKATLIGAEGGIVFAALVVLICWLGQGGNETMRALANVLESVPVLLALRLGLKDPHNHVLCFLYWIIIGGGLGFLVGFKRPIPGMLAVGMLVVLLVLHELAQMRLAQEMETAGNALGAALSGGLKE